MLNLRAICLRCWFASLSLLKRSQSVLSTEAERNRVLESALGHMSYKMADLIREALVHPTNPNNLQNHSYKQMTSNGGYDRRRPHSAHPITSNGPASHGHRIAAHSNAQALQGLIMNFYCFLFVCLFVVVWRRF